MLFTFGFFMEYVEVLMYAMQNLGTNNGIVPFFQDMRANIFAFFFNQFSFSWLHFGVKQYGKFNLYVGLVNGVSWYLKRLKCKGNTSWFWGVKIE